MKNNQTTNTIVKIDDLGTTTITNATSKDMDSLDQSITRGLFNALFDITVKHLDSNRVFFGVDGMSLPNIYGEEKHVSGDEMAAMTHEAFSLFSAYLNSNASRAKQFIQQYDSEETLKLLTWSKFILGDMPKACISNLMKEWEKQTDAGDATRLEMLSVLNGIIKKLEG